MKKTGKGFFFFVACAVIMLATIMGGPVIAGAILLVHWMVNGKPQKSRSKTPPIAESGTLAKKLILSHSAEEFIKKL